MRQKIIPLVPVIAAVSLVHMSESALQSLLPIRLAVNDAASFETGLIVTSYAVGFMMGCFVAPWVIKKVGHIRAYSAFAALAAPMLLSLQVAIVPELWAVLRIGMGVCLAGIFTVADNWVNARTASAVRGQVLSIYAMVITIAVASGQLLLSIDEILEPTIIMLLASLIMLALVPVCLTKLEAPSVPEVTGVSIPTLWGISQTATIGCFLTGMFGASLIGVFPFYFSSNAVPASLVGFSMMMLQLGKLLLQWPLGRLSDIVDRRFVLLTASGVMVMCLIFIGFIAPGEGSGIRGDAGSVVQAMIFASIILLGGTSLTQFSICAAQAHDRAHGGQRVMVSSSLLFCWASGAITGPIICTSAMSVFGLKGVIYSLMSYAAFFFVFTGIRMLRTGFGGTGEKNAFLSLPISSFTSQRLDPRNISSSTPIQD